MSDHEPAAMGARAWLLLAATALVWSSSFAFIKVAVDAVAPATLTFARCLVGAAVLWALAWGTRQPARPGRTRGEPVAPYRPAERWALVVNAALIGIPFTLVAWGETRLDSGLAGILNATTPLFATLLALRFDREHRGGTRRVLGAGVGFAGVALLLGGSTTGSGEALAMVAALTAALGYGVGAVLCRVHLGDVDPTRVAAWAATLSAAGTLLPAFARQGMHLPSAQVLWSLAWLGVGGTGIGMWMYYRLLAMVGASRASMVTYLMPPLALVYGAAFLGEQVTVLALVAMGVILAGVWIGSRAAGPPSPDTDPLPDVHG